MIPFTSPRAYSRVKFVQSFDELVSTRFDNGINALCWERSLPGNFNEIVECLRVGEGIISLDEALLNDLPLSFEGRAAANVLLEDQKHLREFGLSPILDCIHAYPRDEDAEVVPTDVYSFHADSATVETDTYLCSYNGPATEGLCNEDAQRRIDIPEIRAALLTLFGGEDDCEFADFLRESCYDLHYAPVPPAPPFSFGIGNLWRIAVDYPGSPVPPCIHRAPQTLPGQSPRLLLIS